jgi:BclA C-terminal domain
MKPIPSRTTTLRLLIALGLTLACFGLLPKAHAQVPDDPNVPAPDATVAFGNTAFGDGALVSLTTGVWDSAFGFQALNHNTTGHNNTAMGLRSLFSNVNGNWNAGHGVYSLYRNVSGLFNSAYGNYTLSNNISGDFNTATGYGVLWGNSADRNTGDGYGVLFKNTTGSCNTGVGYRALINNRTGINNIAVGCEAGSLATGSNNIYIGNLGVFDEDNTIRIGDPAIYQNAYINGIPAGGLAAILFDYNTSGAPIVIGVGGAVPFNTLPLIVGTAISKTNDTTFTLHKDGVYRVTYTLRTAVVSLAASVRIRVNGVGFGPTAGLVTAGAPLTDMVTFVGHAGDTLQLFVGGVALTLATGDNATINIDKVQ